MRVFTNEPFIRKRAKLGQIASWAGLGILAVGMVISLRSNPGTFLRFTADPQAIVRSVERGRDAIGFLDYASLQQSPGNVKVLAIDGVTPDEESIQDGSYPLSQDSNAVVAIVNPQATWLGEGVSQEQLAKIYSTELKRWSEVESTWPNAVLMRYSPAANSPAFAQFTEQIMAPAYGPVQGAALLQGTPNPSYRWMILGSFAALILGFIGANVGSYFTRRFGRSPRPDERLTKELKGFDDRYTLFNWVLPAAYVFMGPSGLYTFALREHKGKVTNEADRWKHSGSRLLVFLAFSNEGIGNPTKDAQDDAAKMQAFLAENAPDLNVEVQPLALFTNPEVQLELKNPAIPVVKPDGLKALLRLRAKDHRLDNQTLQRLETVFTAHPR